MTKRIFALMLALLMLCTLAACSPDDELIDDPVINIGIQTPTYKDSHGDTFTYEYLSSTTVAITGFSGSDEPHLVTIPAVIEDRQVVAIADQAFYANSNISDIKCEAQLTSVGNYAFAYCEALKTVELPASVKTVGKGSFYNCSALTSCVLPEGVTTIDNYAFAGCAALPSITFPSTLTTIGEYTFANCTALTAIVIPEGATTVGAQAFYNCTAVEALNLPASLTEIGEWAFNPIVRDLPDEAITVVADSVAAKYVKQFRP
jgi:hypothetical protein